MTAEATTTAANDHRSTKSCVDLSGSYEPMLGSSWTFRQGGCAGIIEIVGKINGQVQYFVSGSYVSFGNRTAPFRTGGVAGRRGSYVLSCSDGIVFSQVNSTSSSHLADRATTTTMKSTTGTAAPAAACGKQGQDCQQSKCCRDPEDTCFEKDKYWAGCNRTCSRHAVWVDGAWKEQEALSWTCKALSCVDLTGSYSSTVSLKGSWMFRQSGCSGVIEIAGKFQGMIAFAVFGSTVEFGNKAESMWRTGKATLSKGAYTIRCSDGVEFSQQNQHRNAITKGEVPASCFEEHVRYSPLNMLGQDRSFEPAVAACQKRCKSVPGCQHWSSWGDGGCHLQDANATMEPEQKATSGPPNCPPAAIGQSQTLAIMGLYGDEDLHATSAFVARRANSSQEARTGSLPLSIVGDMMLEVDDIVGFASDSAVQVAARKSIAALYHATEEQVDVDLSAESSARERLLLRGQDAIASGKLPGIVRLSYGLHVPPNLSGSTLLQRSNDSSQDVSNDLKGATTSLVTHLLNEELQRLPNGRNYILAVQRISTPKRMDPKITWLWMAQNSGLAEQAAKAVADSGTSFVGVVLNAALCMGLLSASVGAVFAIGRAALQRKRLAEDMEADESSASCFIIRAPQE